MNFSGVIWDCDGCLLDSEVLSGKAAADKFTEVGWPISTRDFIDRFAGIDWEVIYATLEKDSGMPLREMLPYRVIHAYRDQLFETSLERIPYVKEAIREMGLPVCIASGSEPDRLAHSLKLGGLFSLFEDKIFSAAYVKRGKPHPDLFHYAADQMKWLAQDCLVIEDNSLGVVGGHAAGMTVFGFAGGGHVSPAWRQRLIDSKPDLIFDDMRLLPQLALNFDRRSLLVSLPSQTRPLKKPPLS